MKGQTLDDSQLSDLYEGLKLNDINNYAYILTGKVLFSFFKLYAERVYVLFFRIKIISAFFER